MSIVDLSRLSSAPHGVEDNDVSRYDDGNRCPTYGGSMLKRRSLLPALLISGLVVAPATAASATDSPRRVDRTGAVLTDRDARGAKTDRGSALRAEALRASTYFETPQSIPTGSWPESVAIGDVTGDGRNDVVLSTNFYFDEENDYKLFVYAQRPDGTLEAGVRYDTLLGYSDSSGIALLDATGDGRSDVAVATGTGVQILAQTEEGTLADRGLIAGSPGAGQLAVTDLDGDGDSDLLSTGSTGISQLRQDAAGAFTVSLVSPDGSGSIRAGDLNGDGRPDVVGYRGYTATVYRNLATGWQAQAPLTVSEYINGVDVADVTHDDRADLVISAGGNRPASQVFVVVQNRRGVLNAPISYPVVDIPEPIRVADVDADGRNDVVTVHGGWVAMSTLRQKGNRTLAEPVVTGVPYASHYNESGLALGDITGDGLPDAVIADYNHGLVVARNAG